MFYYWDKYEKKVYDNKGIENSPNSLKFLLKYGIVKRITHEHGERHCILYKNGKYKIIKKTIHDYNYKKRVRTLVSRGWQIVKYFNEKSLRTVDYDDEAHHIE